MGTRGKGKGRGKRGFASPFPARLPPISPHWPRPSPPSPLSAVRPAPPPARCQVSASSRRWWDRLPGDPPAPCAASHPGGRTPCPWGPVRQDRARTGGPFRPYAWPPRVGLPSSKAGRAPVLRPLSRVFPTRGPMLEPALPWLRRRAGRGAHPSLLRKRFSRRFSPGPLPLSRRIRLIRGTHACLSASFPLASPASQALLASLLA